MYNIDLTNIVYLKSPFPHCIIDNFFDLEIANKIHEEILTLNIKDADHKFINKKNLHEYNKFAFDKINKLSPYLQNIFKYLNSKEFITQIEKLTGISDIITGDATLRGGGIHMIKNEGRLAMHTDFNIYNHSEYGKLDRRINLLLYMNKDWDCRFKGDLLLVDQDKPTTVHTRIKPIFNRCVIFNTTNKSIHGHPEALNVPKENIYRKSIANYYYTKNKNTEVDFEGVPPHSTLWYETPQNL